MAMRPGEPFNELRRMQDTLDHFRRGFNPAPAGAPPPESWAIPLDVVQEEDAIIVHASLPGVNPEAISVAIDNDVLTIRGQTAGERERREGNFLMRERRAGNFHRALRLPDTLDTEKAQPRYDNGVLTIAFPKLAARQARQLKIQVGNSAETPAATESEPA